MPPASNKPHSAGKYSGLASNLAHLGRMRLSPGLGAAARWQMMLQVEHGGQQLTSESPVHPLRTDASSGVGNSSAQTVDAHVHREWEGARKRSAAGGMERSGSLCGRGCRSAEADAWEILRGSRSGIIEKQLPPGTAQSTIGKQLHSAKHGTIGE